MASSELAEAITTAIRDAVDAGELAVTPPEAVRVERPRVREHGDYASNVAMQLAKEAGRPPREVAQVLADRLSGVAGIAKVDVAGPGFLNFTLETATAGELVRTIVEAGRDYGRSDTFHRLKVNLEFVSANPTGPIHIGGVRWAVVGDALARVLEAANADVTREYYFNDAGTQIDRFASSLLAAARGEPTPEDGYGGQYIKDIAQQVETLRPGLSRLPDEEALKGFRDEGIALMFEEIKKSLENFGVHFDVYFNEKTLHETGKLDAALEKLRDQGHVFEKDGAVWVRTTTFGDDKDRVLVKADGSWTYFAADCAYYLDKRERGFQKVIIMLGADHQGYIGRMQAMAAAFGDTPEDNLEILIGQLVNLVKDGQQVRMSKRAGTVLTLDDLVDAVGVDATRYALGRASVDSPIDLDADLLTARVRENPVYYVQYAHARMCAVQRKAAERGIERGALEDFRPDLLDHEMEEELLAALGKFPRVVAAAAELREVHRVARYLEELAGTYHRFYSKCRILPLSDEPVSDRNRARLWLAEATQIVLRNGLSLLGVSAPESM